MAGAAVTRGRRIVAVASILLTVAADLGAQSPLGAALTAISREDYGRAAEILKPLAEIDPGGDPAAQFLMGTLYEDGRGVAQDPLRACALYQQAANVAESPFGAQAQRLFRVMMQRGPEFVGNCQMLARIGIDNRFEPVTFDLPDGRSIEWQLRGATVRTQGRVKESRVVPPIRGAAFLPLQHTALRAPGAAGAMRQFDEMLVWMPDATKGWSLSWFLFEIVQDNVVEVAMQPGLAFSDRRPAPGGRVDPRTLVSFTLQEDGRVTWTPR